jgi:tetratricopeptide (TPR) repeat protein
MSSPNSTKALKTTVDIIADDVHELNALNTENIKTQYEFLRQLITSQFNHSTKLILISGVIFFGLYATMSFIFRQPTNTNLINQLQETNTSLKDISQSLLNSKQLPKETINKTLDVIASEAKFHGQAIEELRKSQQQINPEGLSLLQLLGGSAVLGLIGFLGLQRLQNLDGELQQLRSSTLDQVNTRMIEGQNSLEAAIHIEVEKQMQKTGDEINNKITLSSEAAIHIEVEKKIQKTGDEIDNKITLFSDDFYGKMKKIYDDFQVEINISKKELQSINDQVAEVSKRYGWVEDKKLRDSADDIANVSSVFEASQQAQKFLEARQMYMARRALNQIIKLKLPGSNSDFYDAHIAAQNAQDINLALEILNQGLSSFEDDYDMLAAKGNVLATVGRQQEAVTLFDDWRKRKPHDFFRSGRPMTLYSNTIQSGELTPQAIGELEALFQEATQHLSKEVMIWSGYATFERYIGCFDKAEKIYLEALNNNPFNQNLNYQLGNMLLQGGRAADAIKYLEESWRVDYQVNNFTSDISPYMIQGTLAQAYEAVQILDKAELLYRNIVKDLPEDQPITRYAQNRLIAISWQTDQFASLFTSFQQESSHQ